MYVGASQPGFIVMDSTLIPHAFNFDAVQILSFPESLKNILDMHGYLKERIRARLFERPANSPAVSQLKSGRRTYVCKSFPIRLNGISGHSDSPGLLFLLERPSSGDISLDRIAERFALTERERETVRLLFEGLSSKEIADRMNISPHTVNAFVRLVMVKLGVSNRSGIVGKIARFQV